MCLFGPKCYMCEVNQFKVIFSKMVKYNPFGLKRHKIIDFDWLDHVSKITMIMSCLSLNYFSCMTQQIEAKNVLSKM